jgi:hypothetical protein
VHGVHSIRMRCVIVGPHSLGQLLDRNIR